MNLLQLQEALQAEGYSNDTAAAQTIFLNNAYREVCGMKRWPFLEKQDATLNTVAGTSAYTLPMSDWLHLDAVRLEQASINSFLNMEHVDPQDFRDYEHIDRDQSTPIYWSFFNQQLHLYPNPDGVYTVRIDYIKQPADLVNPDDIPVLPLIYHEVLVWGAIYRICFRERDWLGRQFAQGQAQDLLTKMEEEYMVRQRQTSSHVKKSGHFETNVPYPFVHEGW